MDLQGQLNLAESGLNLTQLSRGVISACTTDGVSVTTLRFLDAFGAQYPVSSFLLSKVRDVCVSDRQTLLGSIKIAVGFSRGDATSLLATSRAGLSAISFIVVAIEMFIGEDLPWVLMELSSNSTPSSSEDIVFPSPREIDACISAIQVRSAGLDFCTRYANMVTAIRRAKMIANTADTGTDQLTGIVDSSAAVPLLRKILGNTPEKQSCIRIKGQQGAGLLAAALSWWYPQSVQIISYGVTIWPLEAAHPQCVLEVTPELEIHWWEESRVCSLENLLPQSLKIEENSAAWPDPHLHHPVEGFVPGVLGTLGCFTDSDESPEACQLIASLVFRLTGKLDVFPSHNPTGYPKSFLEYLGDFTERAIRINGCIQRMCLCLPKESDDDSSILMQRLEQVVASKVPAGMGRACTCELCLQTVRLTTDIFSADNVHCRRHQLRCFLGAVVLKVFHHILVVSDFNYRITIGYSFQYYRPFLQNLSTLLYGKRPQESLHHVFSFISNSIGVPWETKEYLAGSSFHGTCIYLPAIFWPTMHQPKLSEIRITQGSFVFRDQYSAQIKICDEKSDGHESPTEEDILQDMGHFMSSVFRSPPTSSYSVRDMIHYLRTSLTISDASKQTRLVNIARAVRHASTAYRTSLCEHPIDVPVERSLRSAVLPYTLTHRSNPNVEVTEVFSVRHHVAGALYACDTKRQIIVVQAGCINCAAQVPIQPIDSRDTTGLVGRRLIYGIAD